MCKLSDIKLKGARIEIHTYLNAGEAQHASIRRILRSLEADLNAELSSSTSLHAVNCTVNAVIRFFPMLRVFGVLSAIPNISLVLPSHVDRVRAMEAARSEYSKIVAQQRINRAIPSAELDLGPGDMICVYRENAKQWVGPLPCVYRDGKQFIIDISGTLKFFHICQVKPAAIEDLRPNFNAYLTEVIRPSDSRPSRFGVSKKKKI